MGGRELSNLSNTPNSNLTNLVGKSFINSLKPSVGELVLHSYTQQLGIVLEYITENVSKVLWNEPLSEFSARKCIRSYIQVAQNAFPVQKMDLPAGLVFYLDEVEKNNSV